MRTILEGTIQIHGTDGDGRSPVVDLIAEFGEWDLVAQEGFRPDDLRARYEEYRATAAGRRPVPLVLTDDDPDLLRVIGRAEYARPGDRVAIFQCLRIMLQVDGPTADADFSGSLVVAAHHRLRAWALIALPGRSQDVFRIRTRADHRHDLEQATESLATCLVGRRRLGEPHGAFRGVGRRRTAGRVVSDFSPVRMREAAYSHDLATGDVVQLHGMLSVLWRAVLSPTSKWLGLMGVLLTCASLAIFLTNGHDPVGHVSTWVNGALGRLATAFFGASAVTGAERAIALGAKLRPAGSTRYGALISWHTPRQRT